MRSQRLKDFYFAATQPLARLNGMRWRLFGRKPQGAPLYLNLGCGDKYLPGFFNIEGNFSRKKDLWLDLRNGLPFADASVDGIYACHVFEHFFLDELKWILKECRRVLRPNAGLRILVPSLDQAIAAYVRKDLAWFSDFPVPQRSLGGKFSNFLFCDGQHRSAFDFSFFEEVLADHGFKAITLAEAGKTAVLPAALVADNEPTDRDYIQTSLVVEAQK